MKWKFTRGNRVSVVVTTASPFRVPHANPTRSTRLPILSLHVRNGRIASSDDCQAEIQFVLLLERRVATAARVPTPNEEPTPGLQHSRSIAEPPIQQAIKFLIGHEVDGKPPILLARFLLCWFGSLMLPHRLGPAGGRSSDDGPHL